MNQSKKSIAEKITFFLVNLFHSLWLYFPSVIFLLIVYMCFGNLSQGQDLIVLSSERSGNFGLFLIALLFLALTGWFGARKVSEIKSLKLPGYITPFLFKHIPRFIGFSFFTLLIIAYAKSPLFNSRFEPTMAQQILYAAIFIVSFLYYWFWTSFMEKRFKRIVFNWIFFVTVIGFFVITGVLCFNLNSHNHWLIFIILLLTQWAFLVIVITRRKVIETREEHSLAEKVINIVFYLLIAVVLVVYIICMIYVKAAVWVTAFPFVLIAFSVFLAVGFLLSYYSVKKGLNIHLILLFFVFLFGFWTERHSVNLVKNEVNFSKRASIEQYFTKWVNTRKQDIEASNSYPVYFVLSDGGASRSGYWVASVLSRMQDESAGKFSNHLFCLSGASGGSVGNAAFYMLLRKMNGADVNPADSLFLKRSQGYLQSDFLTYTLSRMLGYDFFIQLSPFNSHNDRARALTTALEYAPADSVFLKDALSTPFSQLMIDEKNVNDSFPIICVNTTRMQDGKPAVITNINLTKNLEQFNRRIDVLNILQKGYDMKLSTAVVLGASFPYVSPAGRIDQSVNSKTAKKDSVRENYFVDGGYVDNSGAGVVHEMIIQLNAILDNSTDSVVQRLKSKLKFSVLHITNGVEGDILAKKVNPFINDLAAPLKTLVGTFSIQTSVNDSRLKNYMKSQKKPQNYWDINLYGTEEPQHFSMNWVISQRALTGMNGRLFNRSQINQVVKEVSAQKN
ncbi:MAG: patatin-like phospholipase family protein [Sphingobacteriales bacterium]|nr:patatin-like phospholipase family protein [Sphingobacteriales bacterium]